MSSPEDIVHNLSSLDTNARLRALREVKNQIIGNKTKKLSYIKLGAVRRVVEILAKDTETPLLVQSAAAVGSFACGMDAGVMAILDSGGLPHVVEAGARSLKMIFQSSLAPKNDVFQWQTLNQVLELLQSENDSVAEVAASLLAHCCDSEERQVMLGKAGAMKRLLPMLHPKCSQKKVEAALDAIAAITQDNEDHCHTLVHAGGGSVLEEIRTKLIRHELPRMRLHACMCLVNVFRSWSGGFLKQREIRLSILCVLLKLIDEPGRVGEDAPGVLARFLGDSNQLQREVRDLQKEAVCEKDGVAMLAGFFKKVFMNAKHKENVINALAQLCANLEEGRRQVVDLKVFDHIVDALDDASPGVCAAACFCLQTLSRSVKVLRTTFKDRRVLMALLKLLRDSSVAVQEAASGALCNVVLEFSDLKTVCDLLLNWQRLQDEGTW
ncbi:hypothetical protein CBR_g56096 [Chara braunii]|uniref:Uncharacterized protein n=1 Tax=Chara braunii TaxID=69332 RepID=A0A388MDK1_CHABU|nr:hypothetical protein CBR_g56096 [Chara braunii]|eukprot:GBG92583.1 hypothetical protein CBR_g56096 [Chara braunii]